jgi:predicted MFS family arabinose efflux permease
MTELVDTFRTPELRAKAFAIIGLGICLFTSAASWMVMRLGSIYAIFELGGDIELFNWIVNAYIICEVGMIPVSGKLCDIFGEKRMVAVGAMVFVLGSISCGFANTMEVIVASRCIQGLGAGVIFAVCFSAVGTLYRNNHRGSAHEVMTAAFAIGSLFGTMFGWWFIENMKWSDAFFVAALLMGAFGFLAYRHLPEREVQKGYDVVGMVLLSAIFFSVMYYTVTVNTKFDLLSTESLAFVVIIALLIYMLWRQEKVMGSPAFPLHMTAAHAKCMLAMFTLSLVGIGLIQYLMKFFLFYFEMDIYAASAMFIFLLAGGAVTSMPGCKLVTRTGVRPWIIGGSILIIISFFLISYIGEQGIWPMRCCLVVLGMGLGCMVTEILCAVQGFSPKSEMGSYSNTTMGLRMTGIAVGNALYSYYIIESLKRSIDVFVPADVGDAIGFINYVIFVYGDLVDQVLAAFHDSVGLCAILAGSLFVLVAIIGLWIGRGDLEEAAVLPDNK